MQAMIRYVAVPLLLLALGRCVAAADYAAVAGGQFRSALAIDGASAHIAIRPFAMRVEPVTIAEFQAFVDTHPEWRRDRVSPLFAAPTYLNTWRTPSNPGSSAPNRHPVTHVSWFAARAFCAGEGARLPRWYEWEYVAAADATRRDARGDPLRNQQLLSAILGTGADEPGTIGQHPANWYGVRDVNRLIWEWTEDYAAMFPNPDARVPGVGALLALCGGSALAFDDKDQYALIMRVAAIAALKPADDAVRVGFRCVRDLPGDR